MKLQTNIPLQPQKFNQIDYSSRVLLLGSCFSENIGAKFKYYKFQSYSNPFGILFHPLAIENLVLRAINQDFYSEADLILNNEQWCCFDAHSKLNALSKSELLKSLNDRILETHQEIKSSTHIIITLGTAWVYRHIATDKIVANCHKVPQKAFQKEILSIDEVSESLQAIISLAETINPRVNVIFTVSPVRHLKDGFVENTQSKSHLIAAIHSVLSNSVENRYHYFPSYEIMMDELRDYRFYNEDMIHPNTLAIDYIWEKFKTVWFTDEALQTLEAVANIQTKKTHRPFNPNSEAHQDFLAKLQSEVDRLQQKHPNISFD